MPSYFPILNTANIFLLLFFLLMLVPSSSYACWADYCSQTHHKSMELRGVERSQTYEYCQILSELGKCLNETASSCHANVRFHALKVYKEKHWKSHRCDSYTFHSESASSCPFWQPVHDHSRLRYCALMGHPHLRKFDGDFQTCERHGTYPMLNNRYFTIQVTYLSFNDQETSSITSITLLIKNHTGCTIQTQYEAGIEDPSLAATFTDGRNYVGDYHHKSVGLVYHNDSYVEIKLVYVSSEIRIRRQGPYLSIAVRVPDKILDGDYDDGSKYQMCIDGCSGTTVPIAEALHSPISYSKCIRQTMSLRTPKELAIERCRVANLTDHYFDACVFDLMMIGDETLLKLSEFAQHDYRALYSPRLSHHEMRQDLDIYETTTIQPFSNCRKKKPSIATYSGYYCNNWHMIIIFLMLNQFIAIV